MTYGAKLAGPLLALASMAAAPAMAVTVYSTDFSSGAGPEWSTTAGVNGHLAGIYGDFDGGVATLALPASITGPSTVAFDLLPFRTIDGANNCCTDTFRAYYNGALLFSGNFAGGGGGIDNYTVPPGGSIVSIGGFAHRLTLPFTAVPGASTFDFTYGVLQGYGDEAWGLDNVVVDSTRAIPGIPEPASWAMMIGGFALSGAAMRRRKASVRFA